MNRTSKRGMKRPRSTGADASTSETSRKDNTLPSSPGHSNGLMRQALPITLGKPSFRQRIEAYYSLIAPQVLINTKEWNDKFDQIYAKYGGSVKGETRLAAKLAKKYGSTVRLKIAPDIETSKKNRELAHLPENRYINVRDESYYELTLQQKNSGIVDFTCPDFDPYTALRLSDDEVIRQNHKNGTPQRIPILDNLAKFPSLLPPEDPLHIATAPRHSPQKKEEKQSTSPNKTKRLPAFDQLSNQFASGPLSLLRAIQQQRQCVRVLVRYVDCIRGTLTGYLLAFDKHMNMILRDVDENYTSRVTSILKSSSESYPWSKEELETRRRCDCIPKAEAGGKQRGTYISSGQRHMHQVLVRGDCVVMVWRMNEEKKCSDL